MSEHPPTETAQEALAPEKKIFPQATDAEHKAWEDHKKKVEAEKKETEEKIQKRRKELSEPQSVEAAFMVASVRDTIREAKERLVKLKKYAEDEKKRYQDVQQAKQNEYTAAKAALRDARQLEANATPANIQNAVAARVQAEEAEKTAKQVLVTVNKYVIKSTGHLERIQNTENLVNEFEPRLTDSTDRSTAFNIGENVLILMKRIETHPEKQDEHEGGHGGHGHGHGEKEPTKEKVKRRFFTTGLFAMAGIFGPLSKGALFLWGAVMPGFLKKGSGGSKKADSHGHGH